MKNHVWNKVKLNRISCLLFIIPFCFLLGCERMNRENIGEEGSEDGQTVLLVSVGGIQEFDEILNAKKSKLKTNSDNIITGEFVSHVEGFDSRVSGGELVHYPTNPIFVKNNIANQSEVLKAAKMDDNIIYHLIIYKVSDNTIIWNAKMTSSERIRIVADAGIAYNWVAYSYNTTLGTDLPVVTNLQNSVVAMGENKDFLYASGIIIPDPWVSTPLQITFAHKTARIAVELNTMGMFANLNSATVEIDDGQLKTRNFNVMTGDYDGAQTNVASASTSSFVRFPGYGFDDRKVAYFYTSDPTTLADLTVKLKKFEIALDQYAVSQGQPTRVFTALTSTFSSSNFTPELERSRLFKIDLIESPVTTTNTALGALSGSPCCLVTTKWARANLYYVAGHNPYRFHHLNEPTNNPNTYFSIGSSVPSKFASSTSLGDPCELVYPEGVWRTANTIDYNTLAGGSSSSLGYRYPKKSITGLAGSYIEYDVDNQPISQYPNNKLRFNFNGSGVAVALVLELVQLTITNSSNLASLWTSSKTLDLQLLDLGHDYYRGNMLSQDVLTELLQLNLIGSLNIVNSGFRNLRCVRDE